MSVKRMKWVRHVHRLFLNDLRNPGCPVSGVCSRARHRVELVTEYAKAYRGQTEAVADERIAELETVESVVAGSAAKDDG